MQKAVLPFEFIQFPLWSYFLITSNRTAFHVSIEKFELSHNDPKDGKESCLVVEEVTQGVIDFLNDNPNQYVFGIRSKHQTKTIQQRTREYQFLS